MGFIHLTDLASVQLGNLYNYVDGLQAVPQVQDLNELIYVHFRNLSDIGISFFYNIDSLITTRLFFLECRANFKNTFTIFQYKVHFSLYHQ